MKMQWPIAVVCVTILFVPGAREAFARKCAAVDSFKNSQTQAQVIVRGRIMEHIERDRGMQLAMDFDVAEVFRRDRVPRRIRVWEQCPPYVSSFPVGTDWILALSALPDRAGGRKALCEYLISVCGVSWLRVEGANAVGNLTAPFNPTAPEPISLDQFRQRFGR